MLDSNRDLVEQIKIEIVRILTNVSKDKMNKGFSNVRPVYSLLMISIVSLSRPAVLMWTILCTTLYTNISDYYFQ